MKCADCAFSIFAQYKALNIIVRYGVLSIRVTRNEINRKLVTEIFVYLEMFDIEYKKNLNDGK